MRKLFAKKGCLIECCSILYYWITIIDINIFDKIKLIWICCSQFILGDNIEQSVNSLVLNITELGLEELVPNPLIKLGVSLEIPSSKDN